MTRTPRDVAVIVPFLNAEETLAQAVDSLIEQTVFARVHVILVDNNSTDRSPAIAAGYAARHPNVEVTHRVGGGCGGARNAGLPLAVEPYVTFLDADDLLRPESIEQRLTLATSTGSDVVLGAMETFPEVHPYTPVDVYSHDRVVDGIAEDRRLVHTANVSAILFRRDFFDDPANRFLEDMPFEDVSVTTAALVLARRIGVSSYVGYRYRKDPAASTIMSTAHSRPGNYRDHLAINTLVHARHRDDPVATEAVGHMLIRAIRLFLLKAPAQLDAAQLRAFFDGARDLYRHYPLAQIIEHSPDIPSALAFYAVLADDFELFCEPQSHLVGFELVDDVPHLRLDRAAVPELRELLRIGHRRSYGVGKAQIRLDSAIADAEGRVELRGTVEHLDAAATHVRLCDFGFGLQLGAAGPVADLTITPGRDHLSWRWCALIVPEEIEGRQHRLSFVADPWSPKDVYPVEIIDAIRPRPGVRIRPSTSGVSAQLIIKLPNP